MLLLFMTSIITNELTNPAAIAGIAAIAIAAIVAIAAALYFFSFLGLKIFFYPFTFMILCIIFPYRDVPIFFLSFLWRKRTWALLILTGPFCGASKLLAINFDLFCRRLETARVRISSQAVRHNLFNVIITGSNPV